jgi:hypothetical protein
MSELARLYSAPSLPFGKLSILPHPRGGDWLSDDLNRGGNTHVPPNMVQ